MLNIIIECIYSRTQLCFFFIFSLSYLRRKGIIINETSAGVYGQLLTGRKYQINQNGEVRLEKQWSKQVLPFVYQTIVKVSLHQFSILS